jgi:hypothetical protein
MVLSIENEPMESIIQRKIEIIQTFLKPNPECNGSAINPAIKRHFDMEIDILKNAPRDAAKLEQIIKEKERQRNEEITSLPIVEYQDLVSEIEILKFVLYLTNNNNRNGTNRGSSSRKKKQKQQQLRLLDF